MLAFDATCIFLSKIKGLYALHEQTEKTTSDGSKSFTKAATPFVGEVFEDVQLGNITYNKPEVLLQNDWISDHVMHANPPYTHP